MTRPLWRVAAAAALVASSLALLPAATPAGAQERMTSTTAPRARGTIRLASQTPWVGVGDDFVVRLIAKPSAPARAEVAVTLYPRVSTRSAYERTLLGTVRGSPLSVAAAPVAELTADAAGAFTVRLPLQDPAQPRDPRRILVSREGVYPVRVELREIGGGRVLDRFTTHLVHTPGSVVEGAKLGAALVLPIDAPLTFQPDGTRSEPSAARVAVIASALDGHPDVPAVLAPTPETIEALARSRQGAHRDLLATLKQSLRRRQVVGSTFVPVDLDQLLASDLDGELADQRTRGAQALAAGLDVRPDPRTWVSERPIGDAAFAYLREQQVDRIVLPESALVPTTATITLARPFLLDGRGARRTASAVVADAGLAAHFRSTPDPVLAAHHLLADLAVVYFDLPGSPRAVVAAAPRSWRADPAFLDTVLDGLANSPVVAPVVLDAVFESVPQATTSPRSRRPLVRRLATDRDDITRLPVKELQTARRGVDAFGATVDPGNPFYESLDRLLLTSETAGLRPSVRRQYIQGTQDALLTELARVQLPGNRSITLTAREGEIPITIQSGLDYPIRAVLRVDSDKLTFPSGTSRRLELSRRNTTARFPVEARSSGTFPVRLILESADGRLELGRSLFTVRSTAASNVGVVLSVGAGTFLMVWWGRHLRRTRRDRLPLPPPSAVTG